MRIGALSGILPRTPLRTDMERWCHCWFCREKLEDTSELLKRFEWEMERRRTRPSGSRWGRGAIWRTLVKGEMKLVAFKKAAEKIMGRKGGLSLFCESNITQCSKLICNNPMEPPPKPDESDCCNSGCIPCILDVYEDQLKRYLKLQKQQYDGGPKINCMSLTSYSIFRVIQIERHTRDCNLYTFEYLRAKTRPTSVTGISILYEPGQHFLLRAPIDAQTSQKAYTPIYQENQPSNQFTILVKLYENGQMSQYFRKMTIGMETSWRGPYGDYKISYSNKFMLFIAQGTGIAPFYTIIRDILQNDECYTFLTLYFCCNAVNVLLRNELYKMRENWNFKYELFLSGGCEYDFPKKYEEVVNYSRMKEADIERYLQRERDCRVLVCGAQSFCDNVKNMLHKCGLMDVDITIF